MRHSIGQWVLVSGLVLIVIVTSGCTALGPGEVNQDQLSADVSYDWETQANTTITVESSRYKVVHRVVNRTEIALYQYQQFNNERPIDPVGAKFQYPNGTVVGPSSLTFEKTRSRTIVTLPSNNGAFAYSGSKTGKEIRIPITIEGSYEVILPPRARVRYPLLGRVVPPDYDRSMRGDQVAISWGEPSGRQLSVRYYLVRDLWIFGGLLAIAITAIVGGVSYLWLQLRALQDRRDAVDVDR